MRTVSATPLRADDRELLHSAPIALVLGVLVLPVLRLVAGLISPGCGPPS